MSQITLNTPFELPNGSSLPNRIAKSAMSEALDRADEDGGETEVLAARL